MQRKILFSILLVLLVGVVSAGYECSDGSALEKNTEEISIYDTERINGVSIGLVFSTSSSVTGQYSAELFADAEVFTLVNQSNFSVETNLESGTVEVELINSTTEEVGISLDDEGKLIETEAISEINSIQIFIFNSEGTYPNSTVEGVVGKYKLSLTNEEPASAFTLGDVDYLIELSTASSNEVIVSVGKCSNESLNIVEVQDATPDVNVTSNITEEENNPVEGVTNSSTENSSIENETSGQENFRGQTSGVKKEDSRLVIKFLIGIIILLLVLLIFLTAKEYGK